MSRGMSLNSHLVETMMINVADFAESFLTCGTCLSGFDNDEHAAKLLPCSHTLCRACLQRIIDTSSTSTHLLPHSTFRCPICREGIAVPPRGGAASFPPAFIVNQLLDLFASQRRDFVPKCINHPTLELLFCETCDVVFCSRCGQSPPLTTDGVDISPGRSNDILQLQSNNCASSSNSPSIHMNNDNSLHAPSMSTRRGGTLPSSRNLPTTSSSLTLPSTSSVNMMSGNGMACCSAQHNVVTFTVALKRCSEILLHKASLCLEQLNEAQDSVAREMQRLEENTTFCIYNANESFDVMINMIRQKQQQILESITQESTQKKKALTEQLIKINKERSQIQQDCDELNQVVDVRRISKGISGLNEKLDQLAALSEPRVNAFLKYKASQSLLSFQKCLNDISGHVHVSDTYPPLCRLHFHSTQTLLNKSDTSNNAMLTWVAHFKQSITLQTVDNNGQLCKQGGDPVEIEFQSLEPAPGSPRVTAASSHTGNSSHAIHSNNHISIRDLGNGSYVIQLRPSRPGRYRLIVRVLDRPIRRFIFPSNGMENAHGRERDTSSAENEQLFIWQNPPTIDVLSAQPTPVWCCRKSDDGRSLCQPFSVAVSSSDTFQLVHVLDTGNSRVVTLKLNDGRCLYQSTCSEVFVGQAATGMAVTQAAGQEGSPLAWISNWRSKKLTLLHLERDEVQQRLLCSELVEPSLICLLPERNVDKMSHCILVVDNASRCIWLVRWKPSQSMDSSSSTSPVVKCRPILKFPASWGLLNGILIWPDGADTHSKEDIVIILASDHLLQVCLLSLNNISTDASARKILTLSTGHFGGVSQYGAHYLLATQNDRNGCAVRVFEIPHLRRQLLQDSPPNSFPYYDVDTLHCGDADGSRSLRRLAGVVPISSEEAVVIDLGGFCVSRLRYA